MGVLFILGGLKNHVTFLEFLLAHMKFCHTHLVVSRRYKQELRKSLAAMRPSFGTFLFTYPALGQSQWGFHQH
jgi:hypothetical protein